MVASSAMIDQTKGIIKALSHRQTKNSDLGILTLTDHKFILNDIKFDLDGLEFGFGPRQLTSQDFLSAIDSH